VIKKLAIGLLLLILALGFGFWLYIRYFIPVPHETWTYTSISVTRKSDGLVLGSIKVENKKIINDIKDYKIKIFINKNKNSWGIVVSNRRPDVDRIVMGWSKNNHNR